MASLVTTTVVRFLLLLPPFDKSIIRRAPRTLTSFGCHIGLKLNTPRPHIRFALPHNITRGINQIIGLFVPVILLRIGRHQQSCIVEGWIQVGLGHPDSLVKVDGKIIHNDMILSVALLLLLLRLR